MPEVKSIPTVPRLLSLMRSFSFVNNPIPYLDDAVKTYGPNYKMFLGGMMKGLITQDPKVIQHVLQKNHRNYSKSKLATETVAKYIGNGLLTSNGDYWLQQRRLIQPGFHRAKLASLVTTMNRVVDNLVLEMENLTKPVLNKAEESKGKKELELDEWMMKLAFNIVANTLFTTSMGEKEMKRLAGYISDLQTFIIKEVRQPYLVPWYKISGAMKYHQQMAEEANQLILKVIKERKSSGENYDDLLDMLISARYEDTNEGMTDKQLLEESLILFLAGHETTANALSWMLYLLSQNKAVYEKLLVEIDTVVGDGEVSFEQLKSLSYTMQVIQEGMRCYPPAWITDRVALNDDEVDGIKIKKGEMIVIYIYGVHHDDKHWPQSNRFQPERFSKAARKERPAFSYLPFGGGPRQCIGNNFAMMEMQIALVKMLRRFHFELAPNQTIDVNPLVTLRPRHGIKMNISLRKKKALEAR